MAHSTFRSKRVQFVVAGVAAASTLLVVSIDEAQARRKLKTSKTLSVVATTPFGLQGTAGAGERLALPFSLTNKNRRRVTVQVEYGREEEGEGSLTLDLWDHGRYAHFIAF